MNLRSISFSIFSAAFLRVLVAVFVLLVVGVDGGYCRTRYRLNDGWRLFSSSEDSGDDARTIQLPYCWEMTPTTAVSQSVANYMRVIECPASWRSLNVYLKFYGVQSIADLFVNGRYVGTHRGGATAFVFDITDYLDYEQENTLFVRVCSGQQNDLLPTSVEHGLFGGIYRGVELITTPKSAFSTDVYGADGLFVTTRSMSDGLIKGDIAVHFTSDNVVDRRIDVEVLELTSDRVLFSRSYAKAKVDSSAALVVPFELANVRPWSLTSPILYRVRARMSSVDGGSSEVVAFRDSLEVRTGFRVVELPAAGGGSGSGASGKVAKGLVRVNGEAVQLRGATLYHDHPDIGRSLKRAHYRRALDDLRDLGANSVRSAVVPHDRHFYDLCDSLGFYAWVDTPLSRAPYLSDVAYFPTAAFHENGLQQLREIIYQNYNHPSIVMWGLFSLLTSTGDDATGYIKSLHAEAKRIDPTRPTVAVSNQNGDKNSVPDLIVWRQALGWDRGYFSDIEIWREQLHRRWGTFRSGVMYGEEGNLAHRADRRDVMKLRDSGRAGWLPEVRQSVQHEVYSRSLCGDSLLWGVWLSALYDYRAPRSESGENVSGLIGSDRSSRKDAYYLYRSLWNRFSSTLHIVDKRSSLVPSRINSLTVYATDLGRSTPLVYVGGDTLNMVRTAPSQFRLDSLRFAPGRNDARVVVEYGGLRDSVTLTYGSPLRPTSH